MKLNPVRKGDLVSELLAKGQTCLTSSEYNALQMLHMYRYMLPTCVPITQG